MKNFTLVKNIFLILFSILVFHNNGFSQCTTGQVQVPAITNNYARSIYQVNLVDNPTNAFGGPNSTLAVLNNSNSFIELRMANIVSIGTSVTVHGVDGNRVNVWVWNNTAGYVSVGTNVSLDYTFISPINWEYIFISNGTGFSSIDYIDASTSTVRCVPDTDNDGVADSADLDDDNDGVADTVENVCASSTLTWANHYIEGTTSSTGERPSVDAANPALSFNGVTLAIAPVTSNTTTQDYRVNNEFTTAGYTLFQNSIAGGISTHTFTFSRAINNLSFTLFDIDTGPNFTDEAQFIITTTGGATYTMSASDYTLGANTRYLGNNTFLGGGVDESVNFNFTVPVRSIVLIYRQRGTSPFDNQGMALGNLSFCVAADTDNDGIADYLDLDSDNDSCSDANEYYNSITADGGDNGIYGVGTPAVGATGRVSAASYTGSYTNALIATNAAISTQPVNRTVAVGGTTTFTVVGNAQNTTTFVSGTPTFTLPPATDSSSNLTYQWQVNTGSGFTNITNGGVYSGATTATLTVIGATAGMNGYSYQVLVRHSANVCFTSTSTTAILCIENTVSTASTTPTLCINTALTPITHTTARATGISNAGVSGANGLPAGVSASWASNTITISGTPTASGTFNYSIPLTGGCGTVNATGRITVNALPVAATNTTSTAAICENTTKTLSATPAGGTWSVVSGGGTISGTTYTPADV
ncbi:beta strand repeat-containing protein, partial [Flavobacterium sp. FPG59]|uniref:beta strand repeat-containing protein n=1 Tax=Flavobacterium sp. FPG59 TaxID=1929267 RepID=UPI000B6B17BE